MSEGKIGSGVDKEHSAKRRKTNGRISRPCSIRTKQWQ